MSLPSNRCSTLSTSSTHSTPSSVLASRITPLGSLRSPIAARRSPLTSEFDTLDAAVQDAFQSYLAERGVDVGLSNFIVSYSEYKEQKDYVGWLGDVKEFINA